MGGFSSEVNISLKSGNVVYNHLDREKYNPFRVHILKGKWFALDDEENEYPIRKNDFSFTCFSAFLIAPPVPNGVFSIEKIILHPKFFFFLRNFSIRFDLYPLEMIISVIPYFFR